MNDATIESPQIEETRLSGVNDPTSADSSFGLAILAGLAAAMIGAVLWAVVVYVSGYALGLMAIAVGALAGYAVRIAGRGGDKKFGILGAVCAALGWAIGTALADVAMLAKLEDVPFGQALGTLGADGIAALFMTAADPMDLLFLAIAIYEGYKFALRAHR